MVFCLQGMTLLILYSFFQTEDLNIFVCFFLAYLSQRFQWVLLIECYDAVIVVVIVANFSQFHFLLQNHRANFIRNLQNASLDVKGTQVYSNKESWPFDKAQYSEKNIDKILKSSPETRD